MSSLQLRMPATLLISLLAGLTTWLTLLSWSQFAERSSGYLVPIFGGCLLIAIVGMLLRSARVPAPIVALVQLVVIVGWLHHRWAADPAAAGWFPTRESVQQVADTLRDSVAAAQAYAAPVPRTVTEFSPIMILAGVGTAVLVDFLACGLRRVPLAGLPLLAVYTAPVSILDGGVSWFKFGVAALAFLFLIASVEAQRLAQWGHQLSGADRVFDTQATTVSTAAVWSSARKIGFTVTGLAVIAPILVPSFSASMFNGGGNGSGGDRDLVTITNPMADLKRDLSRGRDVELLRVTTSDPDPSYLRISVLDAFDGQAWRPSGRSIPVKQRADGLLTRPPGLSTTVATKQVPWTIAVDSDFKSRWLPVPYPVFSIKAPGDWRYDVRTLDFISAADNQTTAGLTYQLRALEIEPTASELADAGPAPASVYTPYTALPESVPQSVRALARSVTKGTTSRFAAAVRLQQWFRHDGGFTYSLNRAPGNGVDDLQRFLSTGPGGRTGYCEQFAAAMALMGRTLGIPSRVAVGFLRPDRVSGETWAYSSHDLHAWPEMYFEGVGWLRFEPTPASRTGDVPSYTTGGLPQTQPTATPSSAGPLPGREATDPVTPAAGGSKSTGGGGGAVRGILAGFAGALLLALLSVLPRFTRSLVRRRRWSAAMTPAALAEAAWAELRDSALDLRLAWDDTVTLRIRARDLLRSFGRPHGDDSVGRSRETGPAADPEATQALDRLVRLVERARFARTFEGTELSKDSVMADLHRCVGALSAGARRSRRTRATWLPVSLLAALTGRARGERFGDDRGFGSAPGVDHAV